MKRNLARCMWCGWQGTCWNCTNGERIIDQHWKPPPIAECVLDEVRHGGLFASLVTWAEQQPKANWNHIYTGPAKAR